MFAEASPFGPEIQFQLEAASTDHGMATGDLFSQLDSKLADGAFSDAAEVLDEEELERDEGHVSAWPSAVHLLCLLQCGRLTDARFLYKRLPPVVQQEQQVAAAYTLLRKLWQRDYPQVWTALSGFAWGEREALVVLGLTEKLRSDVLILLGKAYETLSVSAAAKQMGLGEADVSVLAVQRGWSLDQSTGMLSPPPISNSAEVKTGFQNLQQLTDYVVHLEQY